MAISWGAYDNHVRVGIDYSISPAAPLSSDTEVVVTWKFYVGTDGWNFGLSADMALNVLADGWGGDSVDITNLGSASSLLVSTRQETYAVEYTASGTKTASCDLINVYNGATPSKTRVVTLPDRASGVPGNTGMGLAISSITYFGANVDWNAPTDDGGSAIDKYGIRIDNNSGFKSPEWSDDNLPPEFPGIVFAGAAIKRNTKYYVKVRARNANGWGPFTPAVYFTTTNGPPPVPTGLAELTHSRTSIRVGWTPGAIEETYTVECASDFSFTTIVETYTGTATSYDFAGLTEATSYYFRILSTNAEGSSAYSATLTQSTLLSTTYNDDGDLVTRMNNLASAVADKLVHLGTYLFTGKTAAVAFPNGETTLQMASTVGDAAPHPDPPTYLGSGSGNASVQINYPGTYLIELAVRIPGTTGETDWGLAIYCNGAATVSTTDGSGGTTVAINAKTNERRRVRTISTVRRLDDGDTVGFAVKNNGTSQTPGSTINGSDLYCWSRVTMIGF